jgi:hypothetical protein
MVVAIKEPNRNMVNVSFDKISEGEDEGDWYSSRGKVRATFVHFDPRVDKLLKLSENDPRKVIYGSICSPFSADCKCQIFLLFYSSNLTSPRAYLITLTIFLLY